MIYNIDSLWKKNSNVTNYHLNVNNIKEINNNLAILVIL
jgi:hypothetical protein